MIIQGKDYKSVEPVENLEEVVSQNDALTLDEEGQVRTCKATPPVDLKASVFGEQGNDVLKALMESRNMPFRDEYVGRTVELFGSDERVDGQGDIVLQNWMFDAFKNNPQMPFNHDWNGIPVGNHLDWRVVDRAESDYTGKALALLSLFALEEQHAMADTVFRMVKSGFLRGWSAGFVSTKVLDVKDPDERTELGLGRYGFVLDANKLLEVSPTTIPANQGTLTKLTSMATDGALKAQDIDVLRELIRHRHAQDPDPTDWVAEDDLYISMARVLFRQLELRDRPDEPGVSFFHTETPSASELEVKAQELIVPDDMLVTKQTLEMLGAKIDGLTGLVETAFLSLQRQLDDMSASKDTSNVGMETTLINGTTVNSQVERMTKLLSAIEEQS